MAITSGFYNAVDGDRAYNADQMSSLFDGIITDGIFPAVGTSFICRITTGMNLIVGVGRAWFNHIWVSNDSEFVMPFDASEVALNRIDLIVIEVNKTDAVRAVSIKVIKGTPSSSPVAPTLVNSGNVYQYPLVQVLVTAGVTTFIAGNLTQKVGTVACPYLTAVVSTLNVDAPGTSGNVLTSNGSIWVSTAPPGVGYDQIHAEIA